MMKTKHNSSELAMPEKEIEDYYFGLVSDVPHIWLDHVGLDLIAKQWDWIFLGSSL